MVRQKQSAGVHQRCSHRFYFFKIIGHGIDKDGSDRKIDNEYDQPADQQLVGGGGLPRLRSAQGRVLLAQALGLDRIALGQIIASAAIENEARVAGLSAGDEVVGEEIQSFPALRTHLPPTR